MVRRHCGALYAALLLPRFRLGAGYFTSLGSLMQGFRRDVGAGWPSDCAALDEKASKIRRILQWLEYRSAQPMGKIHDALYTIVNLTRILNSPS
jgi:hypothetical protein